MVAGLFIIRASCSIRTGYNLVHKVDAGRRLPRQHPKISRGHREWMPVFEACRMPGSRSGRIEGRSGGWRSLHLELST